MVLCVLKTLPVGGLQGKVLIDSSITGTIPSRCRLHSTSERSPVYEKPTAEVPDYRHCELTHVKQSHMKFL